MQQEKFPVIDRKWPHIERLAYAGVALLVLTFFLVAFGKIAVAWVLGSIGGVALFVAGGIFAQYQNERSMGNAVSLLKAQSGVLQEGLRNDREFGRRRRREQLEERREERQQLEAQQTGQQAGVPSWEVRARQESSGGGPVYLE